MKKLFTLLTLLLGLGSSAWAQTTNTGTYSTQVISADGKTSTWTFIAPSSQVTVPNEETKDNDIIYVPSGSSKMKFSSSYQFSWSGKSSGYIYVPAGSSGTISMTVKSSSDTRFLQLFVAGEDAGESYRLYSKLNEGGITSDGKKGPQSFAFTAAQLTTKDGKTYLHFKDNSTEMKIATFTVTLTSGAYGVPSLTGAWKISGDDVTGETASVVQGASAPTAPTFTVGATSGTPEASNYNVAYSLKDGSTDGIFTYTAADGPSAISTATAGSATIVATLTTADASAFQTPTTNTFEYTVTVSAASAPSAISVTGAASAVRGDDAVTLTANVTGGVPTPTIEWFKCDDALKTNPVSLGEASTLDVATTTVGAYYYYAVATNSQGNIASDVKTVTIVPQAPTITASGMFTGDSKSVEIAKAAGEDGSAVVKFSIDNGETWTDYSETLTITATTTVKAKVVQSGLESAVVNATYTKFTPSTISEVSAITTWDWTSWNETLELKDNGTTNPSQADDYTFDDIAAINGGITIPATFNGAAMKFKGQYPVRAKKSQAGYWTIKPSVSGTITITFSDTGSNLQDGYTADTQPKRYLNINGTNTEYYTRRTGSSNDSKTVTVPVSAGEVVITAMDEKGETWQAIVVQKIIFTPSATVSVGTSGFATYCNSDYALDFTDKSIQAYTISSTDGQTLTLTKKDKVAKGEPVLLYNASGSASENIPAIAESEATKDNDNKLKQGTGSALTWAETTAEYYVLVVSEGYTPGFYRANNNTVAATRAYLDLTGLPATARSFSLNFNDQEPTGIGATLNDVIINSNVYDLQGRRVAQPQRGLYIMNGRKVVVR